MVAAWKPKTSNAAIQRSPVNEGSRGRRARAGRSKGRWSCRGPDAPQGHQHVRILLGAAAGCAAAKPTTAPKGRTGAPYRVTNG
ncbi:hypothetical protein GCM10027614_73200 [Micromonospora vulcania]